MHHRTADNTVIFAEALELLFFMCAWVLFFSFVSGLSLYLIVCMFVNGKYTCSPKHARAKRAKFNSSICSWSQADWKSIFYFSKTDIQALTELLLSGYKCVDGFKKCDNGIECLEDDYWCDRFPHCKDGSDEKEKNCPGNKKWINTKFLCKTKDIFQRCWTAWY